MTNDDAIPTTYTLLRIAIWLLFIGALIALFIMLNRAHTLESVNGYIRSAISSQRADENAQEIILLRIGGVSLVALSLFTLIVVSLLLDIAEHTYQTRNIMVRLRDRRQRSSEA